MPKLPKISGDSCVAALKRLGFVFVRQRGRHVVLRCGDRGCVVPLHRELKTGTLSGVLKQGGVDRAEFIQALRE